MVGKRTFCQTTEKRWRQQANMRAVGAEFVFTSNVYAGGSATANQRSKLVAYMS